MTTVWWWKRRREPRRISHSCHLLLIQLALAWKLSWHSDFAINNKELNYLAAIRGQKWSLVIAPSLHGKFIYLRCITAQYSHVQLNSLPKRKRPQILLRSGRYAEGEASFSHRVNHKASDGDLPHILLLSGTADRLAQWVCWQKADLASLILWDELSCKLLCKWKKTHIPLSRGHI